ncbi:MAG: hypothetical protein AAFQ91_10070 [Cyanobacteria bacterium J06621_15]
MQISPEFHTIITGLSALVSLSFVIWNINRIEFHISYNFKDSEIKHKLNSLIVLILILGVYTLGLFTPVIYTKIFVEKYDKPQWIATKIEYIHVKNINNKEIEQVGTDRQEQEYSILSNVDQNLIAINLASKNNSADYTLSLNTYRDKKQPVCLLTYGKRVPKKSQFKNIIKIKPFLLKSDEKYTDIKVSERDERCVIKHDYKRREPR